jgi:hypothetical protein
MGEMVAECLGKILAEPTFVWFSFTIAPTDRGFVDKRPASTSTATPSLPGGAGRFRFLVFQSAGVPVWLRIRLVSGCLTRGLFGAKNTGNGNRNMADCYLSRATVGLFRRAEARAGAISYLKPPAGSSGG